ncbi:MAG: DegV family protein [Candidatus Carbobacillus altaicus]|nr:DegV family protein [Candidatus Carbobacillus altaicus]
MRKMMVVTDSASDLPDEITKREPSLKVISFPKEGKLSPLVLLQQYEALFADPAVTTIFSVHISGRVSEIVQAAKLASSMLKSEREVIVLDSRSLSLGQGLMVLSLVRCVEKKHMVRTCLDRWEDSRIHTHVFLLRPTQPRGRSAPISRLAAKLHTWLGLYTIQTINKWGELTRGQVIRGPIELETTLERQLRARLDCYQHRAYRIGLSYIAHDHRDQATSSIVADASPERFVASVRALPDAIRDGKRFDTSSSYDRSHYDRLQGQSASLDMPMLAQWKHWLESRFKPQELIIGSIHSNLAARLHLTPGTMVIALSPAYDDQIVFSP